VGSNTAMHPHPTQPILHRTPPLPGLLLLELCGTVLRGPVPCLHVTLLLELLRQYEEAAQSSSTHKVLTRHRLASGSNTTMHPNMYLGRCTCAPLAAAGATAAN
jgi:hypothetical protein